MIRRNHASREAAVRAARGAGYWPRHRYDGLLVLSNGDQELGIVHEGRARSQVWHLVEPPADWPGGVR